MTPELHGIVLQNRQEYTVEQADLTALLISVLQPDQQPAYYDLSLSELTKRTGRRYKLAELQRAVELLGSRVYKDQQPAGTAQFWLLQHAVFLIGTRIVRVYPTPVSIPYLLVTQRAYPFATLAILLRMTSRYARLLYLLCDQWGPGTRRLPLSEFQLLIGLANGSPHQLAQISQLRNKVLNPAVCQVQKYTDFRVEYEFEREGRSYSSIHLTLTRQGTSDDKSPSYLNPR